MVGSLPKCFDKEYFDVQSDASQISVHQGRVAQSRWQYVNHFYMDYLGQSRYVGILEYVYEGITFYFIDNESYFNGAKALWRLVLGSGEVLLFLQGSSVRPACDRISSLMWCTAMTGRQA